MSHTAARGETALDTAVLRELVELSGDGLAVLDDRGHFVTINPAGVRILGIPEDRLLGTRSPFDGSRRNTAPSCDEAERAAWVGPDGRRRYLEYRVSGLADGRAAVWFTDITELLRQQERLTAITRAASSVADSGSLRETLDAMAREVGTTAGISAVQILAMDDPDEELRLLGMAGFGETTDFVERLAECRRRGADIRFLEALERMEPVVVLHRKPVIMADPAWEPLHVIMDWPDWDSFASMPLVVRGRTVGVINVYYAPGEDPGPSSLAFLSAMADQAAVAIETASLLTRTRSRAQLDERRKLARDLHDSVVQHLFSMGMQARALRAQLDRPDADLRQIRSGAQELAELSQNALADLRGLVFELRPLELAERGLVDAVRSHAASLQTRTGLTIDVRAPVGDSLDLDPEVAEDVYRIVQEALHNVVKHSGATRADVTITTPEHDHRGLLVKVSDNGRGKVQKPRERTAFRRESLGLQSMRERAERWRGRLVAGPRPSGGWTVAVSLPAQGTYAMKEAS
ncbi:GAF domain-containing protein [Saccharomonospora sp.]|uniref:PAS domain-containing sensor histidine kinase n=1 Tax=Saccharomonospora sp. TaxID=33913 RepID=UPI00262F7CEB|nr:GAF domain-containing protein [Saccharomonospora sp.]